MIRKRQSKKKRKADDTNLFEEIEKENERKIAKKYILSFKNFELHHLNKDMDAFDKFESFSGDEFVPSSDEENKEPKDSSEVSLDLKNTKSSIFLDDILAYILSYSDEVHTLWPVSKQFYNVIQNYQYKNIKLFKKGKHPLFKGFKNHLNNIGVKDSDRIFLSVFKKISTKINDSNNLLLFTIIFDKTLELHGNMRMILDSQYHKAYKELEEAFSDWKQKFTLADNRTKNRMEAGILLSLRNKDLKSIPLTLQFIMQNIISLDISKNPQLAELPNDIFAQDLIKKLTDLDIQQTGIQQLPPAVQTKVNDNKLDLGNLF
jgi:hypothetical protein